MGAVKLRSLFLLSVFLVYSGALTAQQELGGAKVTKEDGNVIVSSEPGRPLYFALLALSETYGWVVDYEDPVYSTGESRDATDPKWRQEHPNGRHFYAPADTKFSANLGKVDGNNPDELVLMKRLVDRYNASANPGFFQIIRTSQGRLVVTGRSRFQTAESFTPVLNQQMQPSANSDSASDALQKLASQCGSSAGVPIELGTVPANTIRTSTIETYGKTIACREQLGRILASLHHPARYALLYDINDRAYYLNIVPPHRLVPGADGKLTVAPL